MAKVPPVLTDAVARFWSLRPPAPQNLWRSASFLDLLKTCQEVYGVPSRLGLDLALNNALRSVGAPMLLPVDHQHLAVSSDEAAGKLHSAFLSKTAVRTYLCPLDLADHLVNLQFGPAEIRDFKPAELDIIVDQKGLQRWDPRWAFDSRQFSRFTWLVVRETYAVADHPSSRAMPFLNERFDRPLGVIEPHRRKFADSVEDALTLLLMAPWEDCADYLPFEWRPFHIPWIYVIDNDPFVSRAAPCPSPNSLTWTYAHYPDEDGGEVEVEVPHTFYLDPPKVIATMSDLTDAMWGQLERAKTSELFPMRIQHFLTHAFHVSGIDEFQAHMLVIESALGLMEDDPRHRPKKPKAPPGLPDDGSKRPAPPSGTAALRLRLSRLLDDPSAGDVFKRLYSDRSQYLHGRDMQAGINGQSAVDARTLARRTVRRLMQIAADEPDLKRDAFLKSLSEPS